MNIEDLTIGQARELISLFGKTETNNINPFIGKTCIVRTYSAGVHIGKVSSTNGEECHLVDALRLWKWEGGGLSLSSVAINGIKGGRLNRTGEIFLINCIEFIPTTEKARQSFINFIEDEEK